MVLSFAAVDIVLRRLFTTLLFYFQCFGLHYIALLFAWDCCCPHEHFCSSRLFFHFDYFCFLVNLHRSDQSNPRGNVTNCSFTFIHSISVMFFFFSGGLTLCEYSVWCCSKSVFRFIMWISLEWFYRECRSNFISLSFLRVHIAFTMRFVLWMYFALLWAAFKEASTCWWKTIQCFFWEEHLAWNDYCCQTAVDRKWCAGAVTSCMSPDWSLMLETNNFNDWLRNKWSMLCLMGVEWPNIGYI